MKKRFKQAPRFISLILALFVLLGIAACQNTKNEKNEPSEEITEPQADFTLLMYICGSNLEQKRGAATNNIAEMLSVDIPDGVNVVLQTGGSEKWRKFDIPSDKSNRYIVKNGNLELIQSNPSANMGEESTLNSFLKFGLDNYPAKQTALILWDHGGGSAVGVCGDQLFGNDFLTLSEISSALNSAGLKKKLAFVGFDACLMANYETACMLEPFAEKMIASEELEPTSGWDYASLLTHPNDLPQAVNGYAEKHKDSNFYTMSLIDLSKLDTIKCLFSKILNKVESQKNLMTRAAFHSIQFGSNDAENGGSGLYDLGMAATYLGIDYDFSDCVMKKNGDARKLCSGLSFYFPLTNKTNIDDYIENTADKDYADYLTKYFAKSEASKITLTNRGENRDGKLFFSISPESADIVGSVQYALYRTDLEGLINNQYKLWRIGYDTDIRVNKNDYTVDFEGYWISLNGFILNCQVVGESKDCTLYSSAIKINDEMSRLHFVINPSEKTIQISGYTLMSDKTDRMQTLKNGDKITIMYDEFSDDLSSHGFVDGENIIFDQSTTELKVTMLDDDVYVYQALITDIYGKRYGTDLALVFIADGKAEMIDVLNYDAYLDEE